MAIETRDPRERPSSSSVVVVYSKRATSRVRFDLPHPPMGATEVETNSRKKNPGAENLDPEERKKEKEKRKRLLSARGIFNLLWLHSSLSHSPREGPRGCLPVVIVVVAVPTAVGPGGNLVRFAFPRNSVERSVGFESRSEKKKNWKIIF